MILLRCAALLLALLVLPPTPAPRRTRARPTRRRPSTRPSRRGRRSTASSSAAARRRRPSCTRTSRPPTRPRRTGRSCGRSPRATAGATCCTWRRRAGRDRAPGGHRRGHAPAAARPETPERAAELAARAPRDRVDRVERPRQRAVRRRRVDAADLRAAGPHRLLQRAPAARGRHVLPADAEPRRPRGELAHEPVRVRHEPRLVRAVAARDRRQARRDPPLPADPLHRRARAGRHRRLLPAERRPDPPRDLLDGARPHQRGLLAGHARGGRRGGLRLHELHDLRPVRDGLRRHRPVDGVRRRGDDVREGQHVPVQREDLRAVHEPAGVAERRGREQGPARHRVGRAVPRGDRPGPPASSRRTSSCSRRTRCSSRCRRRRSTATCCAPTCTAPTRRSWSSGSARSTSRSTASRRGAKMRGLREFSRSARRRPTRSVPKGSYWIPMAQSQKHWIQALLGEDPYVPFAYFYDVSGWSNVALMGLEAGVATDGRRRSCRSSPVGARLVDALAVRRGARLRFDGDSSQSLAMAIALLREGVSLRRVSAPRLGGRPRSSAGRSSFRAAVPCHGSASSEPAPRRGRAVARVRADAGTVALREPKLAVSAATAPRGSCSSTCSTSTSTCSAPGRSRPARWKRLHGGPRARGHRHRRADAGRAGAAAALRPRRRDLHRLRRPGPQRRPRRRPDARAAQAAERRPRGPRHLDRDGRRPGASPLAWGLSQRDFAYNTSDPIVQPGTSQGVEVARYSSGADAYQSGYATGTRRWRARRPCSTRRSAAATRCCSPSTRPSAPGASRGSGCWPTGSCTRRRRRPPRGETPRRARGGGAATGAARAASRSAATRSSRSR